MAHGQLVKFLSGFCGSAAVEVVTMDELFHRSGKLPVRYQSAVFWLIRIFLACAGGALAVGYKIENLIAAAQIGASAPSLSNRCRRFTATRRSVFWAGSGWVRP
jgi:hypothetical protein